MSENGHGGYEGEVREASDDVAINLVTLERLCFLSPENRRLVALLTLLLQVEPVERASLVTQLGRAESRRQQTANRAIARLKDGRELTEHRLQQAARQLPAAVCQELANLAAELADEDAVGARRSAARCCELMEEMRGVRVRHRRAVIVADALARRGWGGLHGRGVRRRRR